MSSTTFLFDVTNMATYIGSLDDNDRDLVCISSQYSPSGELLYTSQATLGMRISAVEDAALAIPIGGIVGIILAILVIILLCVILACFLMRGRRRQQQQRYEEEDSQDGEEEEKVVSKTGVINNNVVGASTESSQKNYEVNINQFYVSAEKEKLLGSSDPFTLNSLA